MNSLVIFNMFALDVPLSVHSGTSLNRASIPSLMVSRRFFSELRCLMRRISCLLFLCSEFPGRDDLIGRECGEMLPWIRTEDDWYDFEIRCC